MSHFLKTAREVQAKAAEHSAVLVAFSGGKDSLAILDLCVRAFRHVECIHLEFVPGLDLTRNRVLDPLKRLGIKCHLHRSPIAVGSLIRGVFCDPSFRYDGIPLESQTELFKRVMIESGIPLLCTGKKESDFIRRLASFRQNQVFGWHPLQKWTTANVISYLAAHKIPLPDSTRDAGGIDLTAKSLVWLHDRHLADYLRILEWYPYAEVARRTAVQKSESFGRAASYAQ